MTNIHPAILESRTKTQQEDNVKRYTLSLAASSTHTPEHPERTARRSLSWDVEYQVWPSAGAMETSLRMQGKRAPHHTDWRPLNVTDTLIHHREKDTPVP